MINIRLSQDHSGVIIIDQTKLPGELIELEVKTPEEMFQAIFELKVRGAPAIGIFAAYCIYVLSRTIDCTGGAELAAALNEHAERLNSSRPTAVNLSWALRRMTEAAQAASGLSAQQIREKLLEECTAIQNEDIAMCTAISEHGLSLICDGDGILTHCNAGPLATSRYGTALGPILLGSERGMSFKVFADETRPLLQGARLTTYELSQAGVDVTLICDNMASIVMKQGHIQACFVGCDRVAANGDTANKIGTSGVAILAKHYGIPFYVLGPTSTVDLTCLTGDDIEIELRDPEEIKSKFYSIPMAPADVRCYNPAFDVTDHSLIAGIVTEKGVCREPYTQSLAALLEE